MKEDDQAALSKLTFVTSSFFSGGSSPSSTYIQHLHVMSCRWWWKQSTHVVSWLTKCEQAYTRTTPAVTLGWLASAPKVKCNGCNLHCSHSLASLLALNMTICLSAYLPICYATGFSGQNYISDWAPAPAHPEWLSEAPLPLFLDLGHQIADFAGATVLVIRPHWIVYSIYCIIYNHRIIPYTFLGVLSLSVWQMILNIFCTRLLPNGLPEAVRPSGSSVTELHRGAAPGCLKRFGSCLKVFWWPNQKQLYFNDLHVLNVFILFHFGIVYRKSWSVLFRWSIPLSFVASQHQNAATLRQNRGVRKHPAKKQ